MLQQFDIVQLIDTRNVKFMSGPKGAAAQPHGNWSIIGFVKGQVLVSKDQTVILAPHNDLRLVAHYDMDQFYANLRAIGKQKPKIDVACYVSDHLALSEQEARRKLLSHNLPTQAKSERECENIVSFLQKLEDKHGKKE